MMLVHSPKRFYADPAISMAIAVMIASSAIPLSKQDPRKVFGQRLMCTAFQSGHILLGSTPPSIQSEIVIQELTKMSGVESVHDFCVWQLSQEESIASAHIVMSHASEATVASSNASEVELLSASEQANGQTETGNDRLARLGRCLHDFGIYRMTLQIEEAPEKENKRA